MSLEGILDQAFAMLHRRGRRSYRALRRYFGLDEPTSEDLKTRLLCAHPQVKDDERRGHLWAGSADPIQVQTHRMTLHASKLASSATSQSQDGPFPTASRPPEAERRQLTVLFCDVVDSTTLSRRLDPEDLREVILAYQDTCSEVIQRLEGSIAQYLGDGLLAYFSYPQAHEDDAQRAVHTGLEIVRALGALNIRLSKDHGVRLFVRIAIHTGPVVVGEIGQRHERLALGETPNIAAHLQSLAAPNTVVISAATFQLIQREFDTDDLGLHLLKGSSTPIQLYRVVRAREAMSRRGGAQLRGLTPLTGREEEIRLLSKRWDQVRDGAGQVVVLSGEAGIGKSRLIQTLKAAVAHEPHALFECWASPYYQRTALHPIAESFQRALRWEPNDTPDERLRKLEMALSSYRLPLDEMVPLFAEFLSIPLQDGGHPPADSSPKLQRRKVLEALVTILLARASEQPVLFILEDLHWLDSSTLEFLNLLIEQVPSSRLYVLLTCRPAFQIPWHQRSCLTQLTLRRLSANDSKNIIAWITDEKNLPAEVHSLLLNKTDGIPLFIEEMTRAILESGLLREANHRYVMTGPLASFAIPMTLQDSLMARLDRLGPAKEIAQWGAVIGRQFSYELLRALLPDDGLSLESKIAPLVRAELLYQQDLPPQAVYVFKHALIQEAAYQSLLKSNRQRYHHHVAQNLETMHANDLEPHLLEIAHHLESAGPVADPAQVVHYGRRAGDRAQALFAWREAAYHRVAALTAEGNANCLTSEQRAELHYLAGFASYWDGNLGQCLDHYDQAMKIYRDINDIEGLTQVLIKKSYLTVVGAYGGPVDVQPLEAVVDMLGRDDHRLRARLLMAIAESYWVARQPQKAQVAAERALEIGTHLRDDEICSRASFDVAMVQSQSLRIRDAVESFERTRQYARQSQNVWFEGWPLQRMPTALFQLGRFEEAALVAEEAREFATKTNNWGHYSLTAGTLTCLAVAKGDFAAAERHGHETLKLLSQYHFPYGGALALPALACAHRLRGDWVEAEKTLHMLMEPGRVFEDPEPSFGPMTDVYRQLIHSHNETEAGVASAPVAMLLNMVGTGRFDVTSLAPYCALIELSACEPPSEVVPYLYTQLSSALDQGILFSRGWVFLLPRILGVAATISQRWPSAEGHFHEALSVATRVGAGPELGLTCLNYAQMLIKREAEGDLGAAISCLQKATAIFKEFRMNSFIRYTEKMSNAQQLS